MPVAVGDGGKHKHKDNEKEAEGQLYADQDGYARVDMWDFIGKPELKEQERLRAYFPGRVTEPMFD